MSTAVLKNDPWAVTCFISFHMMEKWVTVLTAEGGDHVRQTDATKEMSLVCRVSW